MRQEKDVLDIREVVRRRVRTLREERGWSAQQLVDAMRPYGVRTTRSTLANFETGRRADITFGEAIAMAVALDVPLVGLIASRDDPVHLDGEPAQVRVGERTRNLVDVYLFLSSWNRIAVPDKEET